MESTPVFCRNCGAEIRGDYCAACGQREGRGDLHFSEAVGDAFGDVFTWDSRLWRTLIPLVLRPGFLTAEFIAGRRARYMPPFRVYLVISFLMFLVLSLSAGDAIVVDGLDVDGDSAQLPTVVAPMIKDAPGEDSDSEPVAGEDEIERAFNFDLAEDSPAWMKQFEARIESNAERVQDDPADYIRDLLEHLPQMMFLMLPLFAALLRLAYLFSPFHYVQHLVFALHYHSFVYLLYLFSAGLEFLNQNIDGLTGILLLAYLPLALRRAYGSGWGAAIGKSLAVFFSYGLLLAFGTVAAALAVLVAM